MSEGTDLGNLRVSGDDAINDVMKLKAKLAFVQRENRALLKDRADLLREYNDLQHTTHQPPVIKKPAARRRKEDFVRVIANDVHGQMMDRAAVDAFLLDLKEWDADEIVLNGDIIECGGFLAQHHTLGYVAQTEYSFQQDIAAANWFLDEVQKAAPRAKIHFIEGNHDRRIETWIVDQTLRHSRDAEFLRQFLSPHVLLKLDERGIIFHRLGVEHIPGLPNGWIKLGKCFFTHELSGSKNAAFNSLQKTAGNVVFAHTHREDSATIVFPGVGLVKAWNPGCLCLRNPLWRHSDPTSWSHGYATQLVAKSEEFLHLNIPIWDGRSLMGNLISRMKG